MTPILTNVDTTNKSKSPVENIYELVSSAEQTEENKDLYEVATIKGHNKKAEHINDKTIETSEINLQALSLTGEPVGGSGSESSPQITEDSSGIYEEINPKDMKLPKEEKTSKK